MQTRCNRIDKVITSKNLMLVIFHPLFIEMMKYGEFYSIIL